MNDDNATVLLTAVLNSLTTLQGQIDAVQDRLEGIEESLHAIDNAQASLTDIEPALQIILAKQIETETSVRGKLAVLSRLTAFAHASASGNVAPLPSDILSDPLLERFRQEMPADWSSPEPALARWRDAVGKAAASELAAVLVRQYRRSPTETVEHVALRYRMAALSREELERRDLRAPQHPAVDSEFDQTPAARRERAAHLARLWGAGPSLHLYAEAELASAVDIIERLSVAGGIDRATIEGMRLEMGKYISAGHRLSLRRMSALAGDSQADPDRYIDSEPSLAPTPFER